MSQFCKVWILGKNTILKAIHNQPSFSDTISRVWMLGKNTILKAIHNYQCFFFNFDLVWMLGKNTILKAIHNTLGSEGKSDGGVNAG